MSQSDRDKWEGKYARKTPADLPAPDAWLLQHVEQLPVGRALDLACGLGQNALALADRGWQVIAADVSSAALNVAQQAAEVRGLTVDWQVADLDEWQPPPAAFDLVTVFRFLDRQRFPQLLKDAVRPGGVVVYETFLNGPRQQSQGHVKNPAFLLQPGELRRWFADWTILDEAELELSESSVARIVARR